MDSTLLPFLPVVKIETEVSRLTSQSTLVSEYEIPLDSDWEFPRDKCVCTRSSFLPTIKVKKGDVVKAGKREGWPPIFVHVRYCSQCSQGK